MTNKNTEHIRAKVDKRLNFSVSYLFLAWSQHQHKITKVQEYTLALCHFCLSLHNFGQYAGLTTTLSNNVHIFPRHLHPGHTITSFCGPLHNAARKNTLQR